MFRSLLRKLQPLLFRWHNNPVSYSFDFDKLRYELKSEGITFIDKSLINNYSAVHQELNKIAPFLNDHKNLNYTLSKFNDFKSFSEIKQFCLHNKSSVAIDRSSNYYFNRYLNKIISIDQGMLDIVEPKYLNESFNNLIELITLDILPNLLHQLNFNRNNKLHYSHSSLYLYNGCTSPRYIHFDSYNNPFKLFLTLSNINSIDKGPYFYIKGSHKNNALKVFNFIINRIFGSDLGNNNKDATLLNYNTISPVLSDKYEFYISDNSGFHGDLPCANIYQNKAVLVFNFTIS